MELGAALGAADVGVPVATGVPPPPDEQAVQTSTNEAVRTVATRAR
jgi:hypothetical protein